MKSVAAHLRHEHLARLGQRVDVGVVAVALVGQHLHLRVLDVAGAEAEDGEEDAVLALRFDELFELAVARRADVEVAVGGEDDAVVAAVDEVLFRDVVGELDARAAGRRAARFERLDRGEDRPLVGAGRRRQHESRVAGVDDDGHAVLRPELIDEQLESFFHQRQFVRLHHRAGDVDEEDEVVRRQVGGLHAPSLQSDAAARDARRSTDTPRPRS